MALVLTERTIVDRRRGLGGWTIGLILYALLITSFFPTIRDSDSFAAAMDDYPDAIKELFGGEAAFDLTSGPGFMHAELYSLVAPIMLLIVGIGIGAGIGGDQQTGLMDLILANPLTRRRVVLERALSVVTVVAYLALVITATVAVAGVFIDLDVSLSGLGAATAAITALAGLHGLVALAVGAATGQRSLAVGAATGVFAAGYLVSALGSMVDWLEPARNLSPYYHALGTNPLAEGWPIGGLAIIGVLWLIVTAAAVWLFERRDIA